MPLLPLHVFWRSLGLEHLNFCICFLACFEPPWLPGLLWFAFRYLCILYLHSRPASSYQRPATSSPCQPASAAAPASVPRAPPWKSPPPPARPRPSCWPRAAAMNWVWLKNKDPGYPGLHRFWSTFPFARVPFWAPNF